MLETPTWVLALEPCVLPFLCILLVRCFSSSFHVTWPHFLAGSFPPCQKPSAVFVEQSAQDGSRWTGMHMNTSPTLTDHYMKLSGPTEQHPVCDTASWVSICIIQPFICIGHFSFLLSPRNCGHGCPIIILHSWAAHPELWLCKHWR